MKDAMRNEFGVLAVVDRSIFRAELDALSGHGLKRLCKTGKGRPMAAITSFRARKEIVRCAFLGFTAAAALAVGVAKALATDRLSGPPPGFV